MTALLNQSGLRGFAEMAIKARYGLQVSPRAAYTSFPAAKAATAVRPSLMSKKADSADDKVVTMSVTLVRACLREL